MHSHDLPVPIFTVPYVVFQFPFTTGQLALLLIVACTSNLSTSLILHQVLNLTVVPATRILCLPVGHQYSS